MKKLTFKERVSLSKKRLRDREYYKRNKEKILAKRKEGYKNGSTK